jgi:GNAT superfamily N-acetyltransferase
VHAVVDLHSDVVRSARVLQLAGMFDVPLSQKLRHRLDVDLPAEERPWSVGLLVGPSGAGKSTLLDALWPERTLSYPWSPDRALVDDFPAGMGVRDVVGLLTAVGLGSPPAWMRPYRTLSNGEAFRASIARALAEEQGTVVVDEFTSVVDRQVAKVASHAVQKAVRRSGRQLVAATCHYDVTDWLQPDWVFDVAAQSFAWRSVQPHPGLSLAVRAVDRGVWPAFARHHYLSADLNPTAVCHGAFLPDGRIVAFSSYRHFAHARTRNIKKAHRIVVLPDWQGFGIGMAMAAWTGQHLYESAGQRYRITSVHPAVAAHCARSPRWREVGVPTGSLGKASRDRSRGTLRQEQLRALTLDTRQLTVRSFEYAPVPAG